MYKQIIEVIKNQYILNWNGIHGIKHWIRVKDIGEKLSRETGANIKILNLFAFFHDACRHSDDFDPDHGIRAAQFIETINKNLLFLSKYELQILKIACIDHSKGKIFHQNITIMSCWDSDRLDLGRVGIIPEPNKLCTDSAKNKELIL